MNKKQEAAEGFFQKYVLLSEKTKMECFKKIPGKAYEFKCIAIEDIKELEKVKKELEGHLQYLSENHLKKLYKDEYFVNKVIKIIDKRKNLKTN